MIPDYPPSIKYAMRYNQLGFVPQYQSGFVDIPVVKSYVEQQQRNTSTYPAPTGGSNIAIEETPMPNKSSSEPWVAYYLIGAVALIGIYYALK